MAVTGERVRAAAGFDQDVRPDDARLDVDGRDLADADADLILAEPRTLVADDRLVRHLNDGAKQMIPPRPAACLESFRCHAAILLQEAGFGKWGIQPMTSRRAVGSGHCQLRRDAAA